MTPMRSRSRLLATLALLALSALPAAAASGRWLHVRVDGGARGENVRVNVPIEMIEALLPAIDGEGFEGGHLRIDHADLGDVDLREVLSALRDAPDGDFVTVRSDDDQVRVAKERGLLLVHVDEHRGDRVRVKLPLEVVDAMLSAGDSRLDLVAGLRALADYDGGDLITVESDDGTVRVWVDSSDSGE